MKEKKYLILGLSMVLLTIIGVTFAYFSTNIIGDRKNITVGMSELKIIFNNGDDIVAENFYAEDNIDIVKTFSVENKTRNEYKYDIVIEDLVNTFVTTGFLVYKITSNDGGYNMTEFADVPKSNTETNIGLVYNISIPAKGVHNYTIEVKYINSETIDQNVDQEKTLSGKIFIRKFTKMPTLAEAMLRDNPTISERADFSVTNTENTTGTLYKTNKTEDGSDVYYYSGNTINNWVKFGKETKTSCTYNGVEVTYANLTSQIIRNVESESECISTNICSVIGDDTIYAVGLTEEECGQVRGTWTTDKATYNGIIEKHFYWRIIRTNEDGSIKMLYSGTSPDTKDADIGDGSAYNSSENDPMYVGYMYGTTGSLANNRTNVNDSKIKAYVDEWYENNLLNYYDKYISKSAIYCNDRSVQNNNYSISNWFDYGAYTRLSNYTPTYKCGGNGNNGLFESIQAIADKFSASTDGGGNGQLKYPIALMTADEVSFAGGVWQTNLTSPYAWYYTNSQGESIMDSSDWYSMSPRRWTGSYAFVSSVCGSGNPGYISNISTKDMYAVRPVISISECAKVKSGSGLPFDPYVIDYDNSCIGEV